MSVRFFSTSFFGFSYDDNDLDGGGLTFLYDAGNLDIIITKTWSQGH